MKRNINLDFFRGIMLIVITLDHFLSDNDIVKYFTYELIGWVTAAEGFVFLSGLTAGIVYTNNLVKRGESFVAEAVKKRSLKIYWNHIAILLFALVVVLMGLRTHDYWDSYYNLFYDKPFSSIFLGMMLLYQPVYLDVLPMYVVFILFVPIILKQLNKGNTLLIFIISFSLYLLPILNGFYHIVPDITKIGDLDTGFFNLLSWQIIFVIGLLSGFAYSSGNSWQYQTNKVWLSLALLICLGCFVAKNMHIDLKGFDYLVVRGNLGPLRLLNCMALFYVIIYISSKYEKYFKNKAVCYLGCNSLEVYSFHVALLILFKPLKEYINSIYSFKITHYFYAFPLAEAMVFLLIIPALYLAPVLLNKKIICSGKKRLI